MDHKSHDKVFFVNFAMVLGALFGIFFICIVAARIIVGGDSHANSPEAMALLAERIKPAGAVVTDPAALLKVSAKPARAPLTGEQINARACNACHGSGMLGAPKTGDKAAWAQRLQAVGGLDGLVASAIKGKNAMPPRGGDTELSDDEVKAAVEHLLKQTGV